VERVDYSLMHKSALYSIANISSASRIVVTFHMRRSRGEMYSCHSCLCVSLSLATFPHYCMDPDVTEGNGRGAI